MKQEALDTCSTGENRERGASLAGIPTVPGELEVPLRIGVRESYRRLKQNEVVSHGDYVANGHLGFEPWEGPGGFQARAFLKPIYRKRPLRRRPPKPAKAKTHHAK